jgi:hypothetical protein
MTTTHDQLGMPDHPPGRFDWLANSAVFAVGMLATVTGIVFGVQWLLEGIVYPTALGVVGALVAAAGRAAWRNEEISKFAKAALVAVCAVVVAGLLAVMTMSLVVAAPGWKVAIVACVALGAAPVAIWHRHIRWQRAREGAR